MQISTVHFAHPNEHHPVSHPPRERSRYRGRTDERSSVTNDSQDDMIGLHGRVPPRVVAILNGVGSARFRPLDRSRPDSTSG